MWLSRTFDLPATIVFDEIGLSEATLDRVAIGGRHGVAAEGVRIKYDWRKALEGIFASVDIRKLTLDLSIQANGTLDFGTLSPFVSVSSGGRRGSLPDRIAIEELQLGLTSPKGHFDLVGNALLENGRFSTTGEVKDSESSSTGRWSVSGHSVPDSPELTGRIEARIDWRSPAWELAGEWRPSAGTAELDIEFSGLRPFGTEVTAAEPAQSKLTMDGLRIPTLPTPINGVISARVSPAPGRLSVSDLALDVRGLWSPGTAIMGTGEAVLPLHADGEIEARLNLNAEIDAIRQGGWSVQGINGELPLSIHADQQHVNIGTLSDGRLSAAQAVSNDENFGPAGVVALFGAQQDVISFDRSTGAWRLNAMLQAELAATGVIRATPYINVQALTAKLPLKITADPNRIGIGTTAEGTLRSEKFTASDLDLSAGRIEARLPEKDEAVVISLTKGTAFAAMPLQFQPRDLRIRGERLDIGSVAGYLELTMGDGSVRWSMKADTGAVTLPNRGWAARGSATNLDGTDGTFDFDVNIDDALFSDLASPVSLKAKGTFASGRVLGTVTARSNNLLFARSEVDANLPRKRAKANIALGPMSFDPKGLQPADFLPRIKRHLREVSGILEGSGVITWQAGQLESDLHLALRHISGRAGPIVFSNLNGVLDVDRLWPVSTRPNQTIAVEQIYSGLPMQDALLKFELDGTDIDVKEGSLRLVGGTARLAPGTFSISRPGQRLFLDIELLSIAELFRLAGIAGLSGEGDVSGRVPITLFPDGIIISNAELAAQAPGVLRYDRSQAPAALASGGQPVELALSALSNFHYKKLIVKLDRKLTGDAELALHLSGDNPNFYEGYPVEFNLTLTGKLDEALRKGLAGYQVPTIIEERLKELE